MISLQELKIRFGEIEKILSYTFKDKELLVTAFTHRSFLNENRDLVSEHNERLEFLGDAILTLIVSDYLFHYLPSTREGDLSHLRAQIVDANACASFLQMLGLQSFILLGKGEIQALAKGKESIFSDLFEAILGAMYLDGGMEPVRKLILDRFEEAIKQTVSKPSRNWKAELQDYAQKNFQEIPIYKVLKEEGPDHEKTFHIVVLLQDKELGKGVGTSKKKAQQMAAEEALEKILQEEEGG